MRLNDFGDPVAGIEDAPKPNQQPSNAVNDFGDPISGGGWARPKPTAIDNIISAINSNPDEMAKAQELGHQLGMNPTVVSTDIPHFQQQKHLQDAVDVIEKDLGIANWVEADPFNAKLAKDDFPQLKNAVDAARAITNHKTYTLDIRQWPSDVKDFFLEGVGSVAEAPAQLIGITKPSGYEDLGKEIERMYLEQGTSPELSR
jgi:hypothetical protein